jgi:hypothetical protein
MKSYLSKGVKHALSVGAIALVSTGILGCSFMKADSGLTPPARISASSETTTPLQPGSREWNDANWGDTGL